MLANFVVVYLTQNDPVEVTILFGSLTLIIPLIVIWVLFFMMQKRGEAKTQLELDKIKSKKSKEQESAESS